MGNELHSITHLFTAIFWKITFDTAVVCQGWSDIEPVFSLEVPRAPLFRFRVRDDFDSRWCKGSRAKIEIAIQEVVCGDVRVCA